jgi:hypothetical protein
VEDGNYYSTTYSVRPGGIPAYQTMVSYFEDDGKERKGRDVTSILRTKDLMQYMPQQHLTCVTDTAASSFGTRQEEAWVGNIEI